MMNAIFRAIRQGIGAYMTHTTRWIVATHDPGSLSDEARPGDERRDNQVIGLPPRARRRDMLGRKSPARTRA
jgi:hypothetical protein